MRQCFYCRAPTSPNEGLAHVLAEAIVQNDLTLPRGAVCDACNQYLGHELDSTLANYPPIAVFVQFGALPGKRGSHRERLGGIAINPRADAKLDIEMTVLEYQISVDEAGRRIVSWTVSPTAAFQMLRFRRALHHVAFNEVARSAGSDFVLTEEFDPIRNYVRRPRRNEAWAFGEATVAPTTPARVGVRWPYRTHRDFAAIDVGFTTFVVGLYPDSDFGVVARADPGLLVLDPLIRVPSPARLTYVEDEPKSRVG